MKIKNILLIVSVFCYVLSYAQENIIELPITIKQGLGPFSASFSLVGLHPNSEDVNNPWSKTFLKVVGIPKDWSDVKYGDIKTNYYQMVYQNYIFGNITQEYYEEIQNGWDWKPDTINLSKEPVKTMIAFAYGKDSFGTTKMVVDANNNLDFSDDEVFSPLEINSKANYNFDSLILKNTFKVSYERLSDNKIIKETALFFIVNMKDLNMYMCCFPQYAIARLDNKEIAICSDKFRNVAYITPEILLINDSIKNGRGIGFVNNVLKNEYITVNGNTYKFKGVNLNKNVLIMEKIHLPQNQLISTNIGSKTFPFQGIDFKTRSTISSDNYKGKYLLIDFWSVSCAPCIQELPNLKKFYENIDKSKIGIIGIVGQSQPDALEKLINSYSITWPQILSDDTNDIIKKYGIRNYPTIILIDPEGIIIENYLSSNDLENKIKELIGDK